MNFFRSAAKGSPVGARPTGDMDVSSDDAALVARAVAGDRAAFAALVTRHYDLIFRVAWRSCGNRADAEDVAQDVCLRLGRAIRSWSREGRFSTWVCSVALNAARDHHRRVAAERRKRDEWAREPQDAPQDEEEAVAALWAAVRLLPDKQREAVTLVYGEEMNHADAAAVMGCAEATVSYHVHAARKRLKASMAQEVE